MKLAVLVWTPERLRVITDGGNCTLELAIASEERYWLSLSADYRNYLFLRATQGRRPFWISRDEGRSFKPLGVVPGKGPAIPGYHCRSHYGSGMATVIEDHTLWLNSGVDEWNCRQLPPELRVMDVSFSKENALWCAGSVLSKRIPGSETEAAIRRQITSGAPFLPGSPRLNPWDAARVIAAGGLTEIRSIDAVAEPVVATSLGGNLIDSFVSFLFILKADGTRIKKLKNEMICHLDRPRSGRIRIFTCQGSIWEGNDRGFQYFSIKNPLRKTLNLTKQDLLIRKVDTNGERIALIAEASPPGAPAGIKDPEYTAVCISEDGGGSFQETQRVAFGDGAELADIAWLE